MHIFTQTFVFHCFSQFFIIVVLLLWYSCNVACIYMCGRGEIPGYGTTITKRRARVPTLPPVTAVGHLPTKLVTCQLRCKTSASCQGDPPRRIRSEYTYILMPETYTRHPAAELITGFQLPTHRDFDEDPIENRAGFCWHMHPQERK